MSDQSAEYVAIVDYGLGNLYSISNACTHVGLRAQVVSTASAIEKADALVLPGVGSFGDAMAALRRLDLEAPIKDAVRSGKPVMGVCLGMQLLMSEGHEFGIHRGLDLIPGTVEHLGPPAGLGRTFKVPHVGWTRVSAAGRNWSGSLLDGLPDPSYMYFVHSYYVEPADAVHVLSTSEYGGRVFCSSVQSGALFACQFHPERSADPGLGIYQNLKTAVTRTAAAMGVPDVTARSRT